MPYSPASSLLPVLLCSNTHSEGLSLLKTLLSAGLVRLDDPVPSDICQKHSFSSRLDKQDRPLSQVWLEAVHPENGNYIAGFYRPSTATALLSMDPDFFSKSQPWLFGILEGWRKHAERDRFGFQTNSLYRHDDQVGELSSADAWLSVVLKSMPPMAPTPFSLAAFGHMVAMGLNESAKLMAGTDLRWWLARDAKGASLLRRSTGPELWEFAVNRAGLDPWHQTEDARPFWMTLLPRASVVMAESGSLRAHLEGWIDDQVAAGHPDDRLLSYRQSTASAIMAHQSWRKLTAKQQAEYVQSLPVQWPSWPISGQPAWAYVLLQHKNHVQEWSKRLGANRQWLEAAGPLASQVLWLLRQTGPSLPPASCVAQVRVGAKDPQDRELFDRLLPAIIRLSKVSATPAELRAWRENLEMEHSTARVSTPARSGIRL